jgi:hypothetical protein
VEAETLEDISIFLCLSIYAVTSFFVKIHVLKLRLSKSTPSDTENRGPAEVSTWEPDEGWDNMVEVLQDGEGFEDHDDNDVLYRDCVLMCRYLIRIPNSFILSFSLSSPSLPQALH